MWTTAGAARRAHEMVRHSVETLDSPFIRAMIAQNFQDGLTDSYRTAALSGGLSATDARQYALSVTVGAVGAAPPHSEDLDEYADWAVAQHLGLLREAEVFVISPAAHAAVMAAAVTLEIADTATLDRDADLPVPTGLLVLPEPVVLSNRVGALSDVAAFGWTPIRMFNGWPPVAGGMPGVRVTVFMDRDGPVQPEDWRMAVSLARSAGTPMPMLVPDGMEGMVGDGKLADLSADELHERSLQVQELQRALRRHAQVRRQAQEVGEWSSGEVIEDPTQDFVRRYMFAFWRLAAQKSTQVSAPKPARHRERGTNRARPSARCRTGL
ncbi:hypothetical protein ABZX88_33080 [Kitasatospora aureofaciens]|uniref:hypothetical protein n=1 Tax=Kitasatospora aureofaciens TaxID=1894 RepID=UPI00339F299B